VNASGDPVAKVVRPSPMPIDPSNFFLTEDAPYSNCPINCC